MPLSRPIRLEFLYMLPKTDVSQLNRFSLQCTWKVTDNNFWNVLSPGQTIAACQPNISQHCWAQQVSCIWPPCCDMLWGVGCCWLKFDQFQTWANNTQHVATHRNTEAKRMQHVAPNNVAICWVGMLPSFGRGFKGFLALSYWKCSFLWPRYTLVDQTSQPSISMQEFPQLLTLFKVSKIHSEVFPSSLQ